MLAAKVFTILLAGAHEDHHIALMSSWVKQPHHVQVMAFPRTPSHPPSSSSLLFCFVVLALLQCSLMLSGGTGWVTQTSHCWLSMQQFFILHAVTGFFTGCCALQKLADHGWAALISGHKHKYLEGTLITSSFIKTTIIHYPLGLMNELFKRALWLLMESGWQKIKRRIWEASCVGFRISIEEMSPTHWPLGKSKGEFFW